jgi:hypothetical protein
LLHASSPVTLASQPARRPDATMIASGVLRLWIARRLAACSATLKSIDSACRLGNAVRKVCM